MSKPVTDKDRETILELHRTYGVDMVAILMQHQYTRSEISKVLRERIAELEGKIIEVGGITYTISEKSDPQTPIVLGNGWPKIHTHCISAKRLQEPIIRG